MPFEDLLFATFTYPDPTPERALRSGVALAARLGGTLTLLATRVDIPSCTTGWPTSSIDLDRMAADEEARSAATADRAATCVSIAAEEAGVEAASLVRTAKLYEEGSCISAAAGRETSASSPSARRSPTLAVWPRLSCSSPGGR
jgi:hypothetical protein